MINSLFAKSRSAESKRVRCLPTILLGYLTSYCSQSSLDKIETITDKELKTALTLINNLQISKKLRFPIEIQILNKFFIYVLLC